jgi:hypothetical protein
MGLYYNAMLDEFDEDDADEFDDDACCEHGVPFCEECEECDEEDEEDS